MSVRIDRLGLMETFLRIIEAGSLSAAAAQLGTTQPTISRRLAALESSLGVPLLKRTTHAIQLTAAGELYVARARDLIVDWQRFESQLRSDDEEPEGLLRVVAPHAFGQDLLMRRVSEYLKRYPKASVEWRLYDGPPRLVEDGIDCAIRVGEPGGESVIARKIGEIERVVIAAPTVIERKNITRLAQLAALPWLAISTFYRNSVRLESESGKVATVRIRPRFVTDSLFALRNAALDGIGVAVISRWIVEKDLAEGRLLRLLPRWRSHSLPVYITYPAARFYPAKLRRFVDMMRSAFAG